MLQNQATQTSESFAAECEASFVFIFISSLFVSCISLKQIQITTSRFYHYLHLGGFCLIVVSKKVYGGDSAP